MTATGRELVLFDPSGTAHSSNALQGLANAARALAVPLTVYAPVAPNAPRGTQQLRWVHSEVGTILPDRRSRHAHRRALVDAMRDTEASNPVFCDMGLGRTLQSRGPRIPASPTTVFIAHQTTAIEDVAGARRRRRISGNRRVLVDLGRRGARLVTHTEAAHSRFAELVDAEQIHPLGWPVVSERDPCLGPSWQATPDGVTILFAGAARITKGLPLLLDAAKQVDGFDRLVVPGRISPPIRAQLDLTDPRVELWNRWLDASEYRETFSQASLVVLPYRREYLERGTYSSILGEAMAHGRPLLVSRALGPLLPPGYEGAVTCSTDSADDLAAGLTGALERLGALERAAMSTGREHARRHHTYEHYVRGIITAAGV